MAPRRNTSGRKPRATKKGPLPSPIPDLFVLAILEFHHREPGRFPADHLFWTSEQIHAFVETAWEQAGPDRQAYYWNAAGDSVAVDDQSQSGWSELGANDVRPPPCPSSRVTGRRNPTRSRTKRKLLPPPDKQVRPATPPPRDYLDHSRALSPNSTSSSISIPLEAVVHPGGPRHLQPVVAPQPQRAHSALPPYPSSFPAVDSQRDEGAIWSETGSPLPFAAPEHIARAPPLAFSPASGTSGYTSAALGIPGSISSGGIPAPNINPSLLDAQRQVRDQMYCYYPSMHPSLGYANTSSAGENWPWR